MEMIIVIIWVIILFQTENLWEMDKFLEAYDLPSWNYD